MAQCMKNLSAQFKSTIIIINKKKNIPKHFRTFFNMCYGTLYLLTLGYNPYYVTKAVIRHHAMSICIISLLLHLLHLKHYYTTLDCFVVVMTQPLTTEFDSVNCRESGKKEDNILV